MIFIILNRLLVLTAVFKHDSANCKRLIHLRKFIWLKSDFTVIRMGSAIEKGF